MALHPALASFAVPHPRRSLHVVMAKKQRWRAGMHKAKSTMHIEP
jgi:hypothetical protein